MESEYKNVDIQSPGYAVLCPGHDAKLRPVVVL